MEEVFIKEENDETIFGSGRDSEISHQIAGFALLNPKCEIKVEDSVLQNKMQIKSIIKEEVDCPVSDFEFNQNFNCESFSFVNVKCEVRDHKELNHLANEENLDISNEDMRNPSIFLITENFQFRLSNPKSFSNSNFLTRYSDANVKIPCKYGTTDLQTMEEKSENIDYENESSTQDELEKSTSSVEKNLKCDKCYKTFSCMRILTQHLLIHAGDKKFVCEECGKQFFQKVTLSRHMLVHTGQKNFKCKQCGSQFSQNASLNRHMLIHSGQKNFKCEICGKDFAQKGYLNQHVLIHTGKKKFRCTECGSLFLQKGTLNNHLLTHSGGKHFKCGECGKLFYQKVHLNQHILNHMGVKNFKCDDCNKLFCHRGNLNRHLLTHSKEKRFRCKECDMQFSIKRTLNQHMLIHTGQNLS